VTTAHLFSLFLFVFSKRLFVKGEKVRSHFPHSLLSFLPQKRVYERTESVGIVASHPEQRPLLFLAINPAHLAPMIGNLKKKCLI
jgi:hypothetical protein